MHRCMYVCLCVSPYIGLGPDIGSSLGEYCHHLRVTIVSSCYQGSRPILSDMKRRSCISYKGKFIHTCIHTYHNWSKNLNRLGRPPCYTTNHTYTYLSVTNISLGFDRCSFIQEELQNRYMAFLSGNIERCSPSLTKRQRQENAFIHF